MHLVDVIIGAVVAVGIVRGYATGLFRQAGSLVGILLGFAFAASLMTPVGEWLAASTGMSTELAPLAGFLSVFVVIYLSALLAASVAEDAFGKMKLSFVNKVAGAAAGGLKAALLASLVLLALAYVGLPSPDARKDARLYTPVSLLGPTVWSWVSGNAEVFDELTKRITGEIRERTTPPTDDRGGG